MAEPVTVDIAVIGGGFSGLSAALITGRARHSVLVFNAGQPRNSDAHQSHSFLTRDGDHPGDLWRKAKADLDNYKTVEQLNRKVVGLEKLNEVDGGSGAKFQLTDDQGQKTLARRVVLATGTVDTLPSVPGLAEIFGKRAHICPYCDGFEYGDGHLAIIATTDHALMFANLVSNWSPNITLFISPELLGKLREAGGKLSKKVQIVEALPTKVSHRPQSDDVLIELPNNMKAIVAKGIFCTTTPVNQTDLVKALGVEMTKDGLVVVDPDMISTVPGLAAVGDIAVPRGGKMPFNQVAQCVGTGLRAGAVFSHALILEDAAKNSQ